MNVLAALSNLFMVRRDLLCRTRPSEWCAHSAQLQSQMDRIKRPRGYIQAHECLIRRQKVHPEQKAVAGSLRGLAVQALLKNLTLMATLEKPLPPSFLFLPRLQKALEATTLLTLNSWQGGYRARPFVSRGTHRRASFRIRPS